MKSECSFTRWDRAGKADEEFLVLQATLLWTPTLRLTILPTMQVQPSAVLA